MRWVRERLAQVVSRFGVAVVASAGLTILLLAVGALLTWADKHALVPAAYASAAVAAATAATASGKSVLKSTLKAGRQRNTASKHLLVSPGQQDKPLKVSTVDPAHLRIHAAGTAAEPGQVPYVERDLHEELARLIAKGAFVLLQGGSAAGKTRLAFEAARAAVPDWVMVVPDPPATTPRALADLAELEPRHTLIWLDDLQRYLTPDGLTEKVLDRLVSVKHRVSIVATLNTGAKAALGASADGATDQSLRAEALRVVERAEQQGAFFLSEQLSSTETARATALGGQDSRVSDALSHNVDDGFGPRLAGGPAALARWRDGRNGADRIGAAVIDAAVNLRLAGITSPIATTTLRELSGLHLPTRRRHFDDDAFRAAMAWASASERDTRACLECVGVDLYEVFDFLIDQAQRRPGTVQSIPDGLWDTAIATAASGEHFTVGVAAFEHGMLAEAQRAFTDGDIVGDVACINGLGRVAAADPNRRAEAEQLYRRAVDAGYTGALNNLALLLAKDLGRRAEAEQLYRRAVDAGNTIALNNLARLLAGDPEHAAEAEQLYRRAIDARDTNALNNLALLLAKDPERRAEAEQLFRRAVEAGDTNAQNNLALLLSEDPEHAAEAEQLFRRAADAGDTNALNNLARLLAGDPEHAAEAEQLYRRAIDAGDTNALNNLALLLAEDPDCAAEAEQLYRRAIDAGNTKAMNNLARLLAKNPARAAEVEQLYRRANNTM